MANRHNTAIGNEKLKLFTLPIAKVSWKISNRIIVNINIHENAEVTDSVSRNVLRLTNRLIVMKAKANIRIIFIPSI